MSEVEDRYDELAPGMPLIPRPRPGDLARHEAGPPRANPDDPIVHRPPQGKHGPLPGPRLAGAPGRTAIVQAQVYVVAVIVITQLWLVTTALFELLSGHMHSLWGLTIASGIGFLVALFVALWPLRRVRGL